jgi:hypothetical protein
MPETAPQGPSPSLPPRGTGAVSLPFPVMGSRLREVSKRNAVF